MSEHKKKAYIRALIDRFGSEPDAAVALLLAIQDKFGFLPEEVILELAEQTGLPLSDLTSLATFYDGFRLQPAGRHKIEICFGTACHARGAPVINDALMHHFGVAPGEDTDGGREVTLHKTACFGCCTMAPVVAVDSEVLGPVGAEQVGALVEAAIASRVGAADTVREALSDHTGGEIRVGVGSCCAAKGADLLLDRFAQRVLEFGMNVNVRLVGCVGTCSFTPFVEVVTSGGDSYHYSKFEARFVDDVLVRHFAASGSVGGVVRRVAKAVTSFTDPDAQRHLTSEKSSRSDAGRYFAHQVPVATEHHGELSPVDVDDYRSREGFVALARCLREKTPDEVITEIRSSSLRGRGGAGYPTGLKWSRVREAAQGQEAVVVANGDEGDPGAFMDRMLLESYPLRVIEGMIIAAYAVGARQGYLHIRGEYPLAVERCEAALAAATSSGLLGSDILGSGFAFELRISRGGGAFVCGEESALLASLGGQRPTPSLRPPYPATKGLNGLPTLINNIETLAQVPWILRNGAEAFSAIGTADSRGTKVLALAGKVRHGGLIEVPMGMTLRQVVEEIGGGVFEGRTLQAVQVGGPSGGCIPASLLDTPIDFEALQNLGGIMGSGGLVVLDDTDCMVDIARYFVAFSCQQACGRCSVGRIGTRRLLEGLDALCDGGPKAVDLEQLERLARTLQQGALCGLCRSAPNPFLSTLRHFREDYEAHLAGRCSTGRCRSLIQYGITEKCTGCGICARKCPTGAIAFRPHEVHSIEAAACIQCGTCREACPFDAVEVTSR
jgi:NADH-quinone oxidoreductase subunit F